MITKIRLLEGPNGIFPAIYGLRLSWESQDKSDTIGNNIGEKDLKLMSSLISRGDDSHCKFLRHIYVWVSITATRDMWQQLATYKIGVEAQSSSTMHLWKQGVTKEDFDENVDTDIIDKLNWYIGERNFEKFKKNLPEGYIQEREVCFNYQALSRIYKQRIRHKLKDWEVIMEFITKLPYSRELITGD